MSPYNKPVFLSLCSAQAGRALFMRNPNPLPNIPTTAKIQRVNVAAHDLMMSIIHGMVEVHFRWEEISNEILDEMQEEGNKQDQLTRLNQEWESEKKIYKSAIEQLFGSRGYPVLQVLFIPRIAVLTRIKGLTAMFTCMDHPDDAGMVNVSYTVSRPAPQTAGTKKCRHRSTYARTPEFFLKDRR